MRERPILYSAPMVQATLADLKTQTRRLVKPQPEVVSVAGLFRSLAFKGKRGQQILYPNAKDDVLKLCPYGQPGDRLYVKEAWRVGKVFDGLAGSQMHTSPTVWYEANPNNKPENMGRYRHARFMPRWASRITLEIVSVRVERWTRPAFGVPSTA